VTVAWSYHITPPTLSSVEYTCTRRSEQQKHPFTLVVVVPSNDGDGDGNGG
jgi:hypothetical protein